MLIRDSYSFNIFEPSQNEFNDENESFLYKMTSINMYPNKVKKDFALEFVEWYQRVINRATAIIEEYEKQTGFFHTCQLNCNACCFHLVEIYEYELYIIMAFLKATNREQILASAINITDIIEKKLSDSPYKKTNIDDDEILKYKKQYRSLQIPCLFQNDKKCLIYKVRPTCCVTYYSYGPHKDCEQKLLLPQHYINYGSIEDWIVKQIIIFLDYNWRKIPKNFNPFRIEVLPISIRDYLVKNKQTEREEIGK